MVGSRLACKTGLLGEKGVAKLVYDGAFVLETVNSTVLLLKAKA